MAKDNAGKSDPDPWETGEYGLDEAFVKVTDATEAAAVDNALGLKMISIRLQTDLIKKFKLVARFHGVGYQVLMRSALQEFVNGELMRIASEVEASQNIEKKLRRLYEA